MALKHFVLLTLAAVTLSACHQKKEYKSMAEYPTYEGADLGCITAHGITSFRIWSPPADSVKINIYENGTSGSPINVLQMKPDQDGTWLLVAEEPLEGKFFTYQVKIDNSWLDETPGIYTKATGTNGKRGFITQTEAIKPEGWNRDSYTRPKTKTEDIILYEIHVRDLSTDPNSGIENSGLFLGFTEEGTTNSDGLATGLDHFKEMGVTHIHILPAFDYYSVDESQPEKPQFNWGYDPQNYNVPEGYYSSNPADPEVRILEMKQMVKAIHEAGMSVVMDVVYNHTGGPTDNSNFNLEVPNYYYRLTEDGNYSNASGCGNETASDQLMMRKYMIESLLHWMDEYHIDGFRFDLMAIHDIETMNYISEKLHEKNKNVFIYGEGWTAGDSPLPYEQRALKAHTSQFDQIASFSDDMRDAVKGHWSNVEEKGFVSGKTGMEESLKFGIVASTYHPEIDYSKVAYSDTSWADEPIKCINYVSCHDNNTLYDKLIIANPEATREEIIKMDLLANTIILTSQGIPFLHAGVEMLRTKGGVENSYNQPDSINQIKWNWKSENSDVVAFYKALIQLRKNHPAFKLPTADQIREHLHFLNTETPNVVAYSLSNIENDNWKDIIVIFNGNSQERSIKIPEGNWKAVLDGNQINEKGIYTLQKEVATVKGTSALILVKK